MKSIKLTTLLAAFAAAFISTSYAGTYTWTGNAGDGLWFNAGNWNYDGAAATTSPGNTLNGDDVVIDGAGVVVTYVPGGDLIQQANSTLTISGGAKLQQNGEAYPFFHGTVVVDGGTLDYKNNETNPNEVRLDGRLSLRNGGQLFCKQLTRSSDIARLIIGSGVTYSVDGTVNGDYAPMYQEMAGGTLYVGNEFQPRGTLTFTGSGTISCNIFAPQDPNAVITFNGPDLIMRTTSFDGFWQSGGSACINVPVGSKSKFTIAAGFHTVNDVYTKTFGSGTTPKFRYSGETLTEERFAELFEVEAHVGQIDGNDYYTDFYLKPTGIEPLTFVNNTVTATLTSDISATVSATVEEPGSPDYNLVVVWGKANGGQTVENWENAIDLGVASENQAIAQAIALEYGYAYWYGIAATNKNGTIWATPNPASFFAMQNEPSSPTNVWTGAVSTDSRVAGNWSLGHVPEATEYVYVLDRLHNVKLDWYPDTGSGVVAGWIQPDAFSNNKHLVMFHTTASDPLAVTGNVELGGGSWTHGGPADEPVEMVNVAVGGSMTIGANARIVVGTSQNGDADDGRSRGYKRGQGPGYLRTAGGSYAGEGGHITNTTGFVSYGSILNPFSYGSGGWGDGDGTNYGGGGIVKLDVGGALTMNGVIRSRGFGYALNGVDQATGEPTTGGAGSGGSINITAASISGTGSIDANGGNNGLYGPGSGGRVKVALTGNSATFDSFTGTIEAVGGWMESNASPTIFDVSPAAGGTVCLQTGNSNPVVKVYNVFRIGGNDSTWRVATGEAIPSATHLPAMQNGDTAASLKTTKWELSGRGSIRLTADVLVESLELADDEGDQCVYAEGHTLTVRQLFIDGVKLPSGTYTASNTSWVKGEGSVIASGKGLSIIIR